MIFTKQNSPRWLIFLIDISIVIFSVLLAYLLRFNFSVPDVEYKPLPKILAYIILVRSVSFLIARSYAGIIRYTNIADALRIFTMIFLGSILLGLTNLFTYFVVDHTFFIPFSIIIIDLLITFMLMVMFRMLVKIAYLEFQHPERAKANVIIYGAGETGITAKRTLERDAGTKYTVLAFLDDDPAKKGKKLEGVDIMGSDKLDYLLDTHTIAHLILGVQSLNPDYKQELVDKCLAHNVKILNIPPMIKWINGELSFKQIKKINIEELLERTEIKLDEERISQDLRSKVIMITGACGSIGSELVRQVIQYLPKQLVLLDQAETPLHYLENECYDLSPKVDSEFIIVDICNQERMEKIFGHFRPEIVFHAAAYKHVPMMENNPSEAIVNNVLGTKIAADLSVKYGVWKFIMISTDKAVNPTSVMGASKRIAEIYVQALNQKNSTRFITTRFGNVLGSNGSVIPLFKSQIEKGIPLTITHPDITRFFMTIPEACQLVLEASVIGKDGEIFIFDMGNSVKIVDLAKKMIKLSGLTLGKDIQIKFTGLRPGEKLYEELLNKEENTLPTHHPQILIAKVKEYPFETVMKDISELTGTVKTLSNLDIVKKMKEIVPEYKSRNSVYEQLDDQN
jgi:FlaA1/EpsC-like NDP-sugar epimerase